MYLTAPEHDSIFGDTIAGVPNPQVAHVHPYPTRYHGPNWRWPDTRNLPWREKPYAVAPYMGFDGTAPLFSHVTGSWLGDALLGGLLGGAAGYLATKGERKETNAAIWGAAGATGMYLAGTAGLLGVVAAFIWVERKG